MYEEVPSSRLRWGAYKRNQDLLTAFEKTVKKFNLDRIPSELLAKYLLYDDVYCNLEWKEIIKKVLENESTANYFINVLEYTPNQEIIEMMKKARSVIIVSRIPEEETRRFLKKWGLDKYVQKIYDKAEKWKKEFWEKLALPEDAIIIGDKLYDILVPNSLGYKTNII